MCFKSYLCQISGDILDQYLIGLKERGGVENFFKKCFIFFLGSELDLVDQEWADLKTSAVETQKAGY